jgi:hypothetical protein
MWWITKHEAELASTEHVTDRPTAQQERRDQRAERGTERGIAGLRALYDTTVGDWDGHTGRPLEMDARIRQRMPSCVEHVHWHLHRVHIVHHDRVRHSRDEARRLPLARSQRGEHDDRRQLHDRELPA